MLVRLGLWVYPAQRPLSSSLSRARRRLGDMVVFQWPGAGWLGARLLGDGQGFHFARPGHLT
jgi:hypothetical protein